MLDMGFLPDIRRVLRHMPTKRQTLFFSATMPPPIVKLSQEMLHNPATINLERKRLPATGITQAVYPVPPHLKATLLLSLLNKGEVQDALVFTRTKHRADRLAKHLEQHKVERAADSRQSIAVAAHRGARRLQERQVSRARRDRHRGARHRRHGARPRDQLRRAAAPDDYIHRVGRTARAELTGSAFTLVAPEDEGSVRDIERAIGKRLPRVTVPDFDYTARGEQRLEVPHAQRIAEIRARKADERQRAKANAERRARHGHGQPGRPRSGQGQGQGQGHGREAAGRAGKVSRPSRTAAGWARTPAQLLTAPAALRSTCSSIFHWIFHGFLSKIDFLDAGSKTLKSAGTSNRSGDGSVRLMFVSR